MLLLFTRTPLGVTQVMAQANVVLALRELKVYVGTPTGGDVTAAALDGGWGVRVKIYCTWEGGNRPLQITWRTREWCV